MQNEQFDRQILVFGVEGQLKIEKTKVGIVGLGGIGSHVVQALSYMGVRSFVIVDDDLVEESNLNRLIGANHEDVQIATPKVKVAERVIRSIILDATVEAIQGNLRSRRAIDALKECFTIFGCLDNDGARLILSELAAAYSIPLIDAATEIIPQGRGVLEFGGRVVVARPGDFCLSCAGEIDLAVAKQELDSPTAQKIRRAHGYGLGEHSHAPAVVSLNGVVANLAVTEFMMLVTGLREPNRYLHFRGERGVVLSREFKNNPDCYTCNYLVGKGDQANIYRYVLSDQN